jgi:hypothetical protein
MSTQNLLKREIETKFAKEEFNLFTSSLSTQSFFSAPENFTIDNTGDLTGLYVVWFVDTSAQRNRTLDPNGVRILVRDYLGSASVNPITITAPSGQTINGNQTETIDVNYGWVQYYRVSNEWRTLSGQANFSLVGLSPSNIGAYPDTNPDGFITSGQAPVQSVNNKSGSVDLNASDVNAIPTSEKGAANGVATLNSIGITPSTSLPINQYTLFNHTLRPTLSRPNSKIVQYNDYLYTLSTNGTNLGGLYKFSKDGENIWVRDNIGNFQNSYTNLLASLCILNDYIYTFSLYQKRFAKTTINGEYVEHTTLLDSDIRELFSIDGKILTIIQYFSTTNFAFRWYGEDLIQIGSDVAIPKAMTSAGLFDGQLYIGANNSLYEYNFDLLLNREYTHAFGNTTMVPCSKIDVFYTNRILSGVGGRLIQFNRNNGNFLTSALLDSTYQNITIVNDHYIYLQVVFGDGRIMTYVKNSGGLGFIGVPSVDRISPLIAQNLESPENEPFFYFTTRIGIFKVLKIFYPDA